MSYPVSNFDPFLIKFSENPEIGIRFYGLAYLLGFAIAFFLMKLYMKKGKLNITDDQLWTLITAGIIGVFVGGRIGYMIGYGFESFIRDPLQVFRVWDGGMASHGGFIGVIIAVIWFSRKYKVPLLPLGDIGATVVTPGIFLGRIANFINGELWGRVTDVSWAWIFPKSGPNLPIEMIEPRHPSQLYEAGLEGLFLFVYCQIRFWKKEPLPPGQLCGEFYLGYAVTRVICECFREPDASLIFGISRGQFYSLFFAVFGIVLIVFSRRYASSTKRI